MNEIVHKYDFAGKFFAMAMFTTIYVAVGNANESLPSWAVYMVIAAGVLVTSAVMGKMVRSDLDSRLLGSRDVVSSATVAVLARVADERCRQTNLWGDQSALPDGTGGPRAESSLAVLRRAYEVNDRAGSASWFDVLAEEVAEVAATTDPAELTTELVQVAAVACQWVEALNNRKGGGGPA